MSNDMRDTEWADVQEFLRDMRDKNGNKNILTRRYSAVLDNHVPARNTAYGWAIKFDNPVHKNAYVLFHNGQFEKGIGSSVNKPIGFLIDDGYSVKPYVVVSWNDSAGFYILHQLHSVDNFTPPRKFYGLNLKPCDENGNVLFPSYP